MKVTQFGRKENMHSTHHIDEDDLTHMCIRSIFAITARAQVVVDERWSDVAAVQNDGSHIARKMDKMI